MRQRTEDLSEYQRQLLADVDEHGLHVTFVRPEGAATSCAYTVGLWHKHRHPEVVVFGLELDAVDELCGALAEEVEDGKRFAAGEQHAGLLVDYAVRFLEVPADTAAGLCDDIAWAYEGEAVPLLQLVWPDKNQRWPWQDDVREGFKKAQPLLGPHAS